MLRPALLLTLLLLCCAPITALQAQPAGVDSVRAYYAWVNDRIARCGDTSEPDACPYYCNELRLNSGGRQWRAVGTFQTLVKFWYTDDPGFCPDDPECKHAADVLHKITLTANSTYKAYAEYLFRDGNLVFYYYKYSYPGLGSDMDQEHRFYFNAGKLLKYQQTLSATLQKAASVKGNSTTDIVYKQSDWKHILQNAKSYQSLFLNSFR